MKMMNHFNKKKKRIIRYSLRVSSKYINLECVDVKVISISITITHREGLFDQSFDQYNTRRPFRGE